jgi:hypothetical protein
MRKLESAAVWRRADDFFGFSFTDRSVRITLERRLRWPIAEMLALAVADEGR